MGQPDVKREKPDPSIAPPLAAIGGWVNADWFNPGIATDADVVGFSFPKFSGGRKQNFQVAERMTAKNPKVPKTPSAPAPHPKRIAGKIAAILDEAGTVRAVSCSRSTFLFEAAPVLFFADIPETKLKLRSATKLRRALTGIGARACIVHLAGEQQGTCTTLMVWPNAEHDITEFVRAAQPEYALHAEFDLPAPATPTRSGAAAGGTDARRVARETKLLQEVATLRQQVETLRRAQSAIGAMEQLGLDDARLKSMLKLLHPDKHGGSQAAHEAATWLNGLRDLLNGKTR
jgi:hypothetical protein